MDDDPTTFRFFHSWFMMDTFDDIIRHSWSSALEGKQVDNPWITFMKKLQLLKSNLRIWNSSITTKK